MRFDRDWRMSSQCLSNADVVNVAAATTICRQTTLAAWFSCQRRLDLDEEIIGLGSYGLTLTVLSSDDLAQTEDDEPDEEVQLEESWTARHAYGR